MKGRAMATTTAEAEAVATGLEGVKAGLTTGRDEEATANDCDKGENDTTKDVIPPVRQDNYMPARQDNETIQATTKQSQKNL